MNIVKVYTKPACMQCEMTKTVLKAKGIEFELVDVTINEAALEYVTEELGYSAAPVVVVDDQLHWAGFQPDRIAQLAAA